MTLPVYRRFSSDLRLRIAHVRWAFLLGFFTIIAGCGVGNSPNSENASTDGGELSPEAIELLLGLEKEQVKLGFIKLTDCAPLVIAREKGFFDEEGLDVELEAQANWKLILDRVISGELDGAHMLAPQPIGATIGIGTKAHVITACSLDLNGNGITLSRRVWSALIESDPSLSHGNAIPRPLKSEALKPVVERFKSEGKPFNLGMVFPLSTHNYELRYWLASGGIQPGMYTANDSRGVEGGDVVISVTPPPQMPSTLEAGTIDGFCVGEPWNQQVVTKGLGVCAITDSEIWRDNPEKVLGVTKAWSDQHPHTHLALIKAIIRACHWLDETDSDGKFRHREEACQILSRPEYVGADASIIANSMTGTWMYRDSERVEMPEFNIFFKRYANYPYYSDCIWYLTQMRRWGQIGESKPNEWYHATASEVYRPDIFLKAAQLLIQEGRIPSDAIPVGSDGYRPPSDAFIDRVPYDGRQPRAYLSQNLIGNRD